MKRPINRTISKRKKRKRGGGEGMGEPNKDENSGLEVEVQGRKSPKALIGEALKQAIQNQRRHGLPLNVDVKHLLKSLTSRSPGEG